MYQKMQEEITLQEEKKHIEIKIEKAKQNKIIIDDNIRKVDDEFAKFALQKKILEKNLQEKKTILDHHLQKEAETAFNAYLQQQSSVFETIARTYGPKVLFLSLSIYKYFLLL